MLALVFVRLVECSLIIYPLAWIDTNERILSAQRTASHVGHLDILLRLFGRPFPAQVLANPPRHKAPLCSDRTFVIGACIAYFGGVAYVLLVWR